MNKHIVRLTAVVLVAALASCGAKKAVVGTPKTVEAGVSASVKDAKLQQLMFVQKVSDRQLYQKNIVSDASISVTAGSKDITLPGSLRMRKDEVIRLQINIPLIGNEVARLEFTPDYVLVIDRMHKEYVKASYSELDFLKENGLSFYSLQALFWNQLLLPGAQKVREGDLEKYSAAIEGQSQTVPVTLSSGKMNYTWTAERATGRIVSAVVDYLSGSHGKSTLRWEYSKFKPLGVKEFPSNQQFSFSTSASGRQQQATVTIDMGSLSTNSNWDAHTTISPKYKKMEAKDILGKILSM